MGSIYAITERVVIWLRNETREKRGIFNMIRTIYARFFVERCIREAREGKYLKTDWERDFRILGPLPSSGGDQTSAPSEQQRKQLLTAGSVNTDGITELLRHHWFRRIWTIQEVVSAKSVVVMCGKDELPWNVFWATIDFIWPVNPHPYVHLSYSLGVPPVDTLQARKNLATINLIQFKYRSNRATTGHTLLDLVLLTRGFDCTDARDKIFALVSLVADVEPTDWEVAPDYSQSVEDMYKQFTLWCITKRRNLQVLSFTPNPWVPPVLSLPSWVPDLTRANRAEPLPIVPNLRSTPEDEVLAENLVLLWKERDVFHADKKDLFGPRPYPHISLSGDNNELYILGRQVDTIKEVGSVANFTMMPYYDPHLTTSRNQGSGGAADGIDHITVNSWLSETLMITTGGTGVLPYATFCDWWPTVSCGMDGQGKAVSWRWRYAFTVKVAELGFRIPNYNWRRFVP
ncbi:hypothetical protein BX600DRAFT_204747 [Xylariales sp. PMI_506]|nr:hypothetical protein BX600DRAFT_204747 [Xylariales sp. PMI_506]